MEAVVADVIPCTSRSHPEHAEVLACGSRCVPTVDGSKIPQLQYSDAFAKRIQYKRFFN